MSIWFVIDTSTAPLDAVEVFRTAYLTKDVRGDDNADEAEQIGSLIADASGTKFFTGSSRITIEDARQLGLTYAPWLVVHETPDFFATWDFPPTP
jgi:hypothetical protein